MLSILRLTEATHMSFIAQFGGSATFWITGFGHRIEVHVDSQSTGRWRQTIAQSNESNYGPPKPWLSCSREAQAEWITWWKRKGVQVDVAL